MPRLFVGWPLPDPLRHRLGETTARLRQQLPAASWTRPETYHLTFAFLGDQGLETIASLERALPAALREMAAAPVTIAAAGFFPSERRPRVGWLGLGDAEGVEQLAAAVRHALDACSVDYDRKPFRPHMTIVRPKAPWRREDTLRFIEHWRSHEGTPLLVDSAVLFESVLSSAGARHIERFRAPCGR